MVIAGPYTQYSQEICPGDGVSAPVVHIRDNMDLQPARYRILIKAWR